MHEVVSCGSPTCCLTNSRIPSSGSWNKDAPRSSVRWRRRNEQQENIILSCSSQTTWSTKNSSTGAARVHSESGSRPSFGAKCRAVRSRLSTSRVRPVGHEPARRILGHAAHGPEVNRPTEGILHDIFNHAAPSDPRTQGCARLRDRGGTTSSNRTQAAEDSRGTTARGFPERIQSSDRTLRVTFRLTSFQDANFNRRLETP
jgi:hypothetical protein